MSFRTMKEVEMKDLPKEACISGFSPESSVIVKLIRQVFWLGLSAEHLPVSPWAGQWYAVST